VGLCQVRLKPLSASQAICYAHFLSPHVDASALPRQTLAGIRIRIARRAYTASPRAWRRTALAGGSNDCRGRLVYRRATIVLWPGSVRGAGGMTTRRSTALLLTSALPALRGEGLARRLTLRPVEALKKPLGGALLGEEQRLGTGRALIDPRPAGSEKALKSTPRALHVEHRLLRHCRSTTRVGSGAGRVQTAGLSRHPGSLCAATFSNRRGGAKGQLFLSSH
jgi:hypothetical protein